MREVVLPAGSLPASLDVAARQQLDRAVSTVRAQRTTWSRVTPAERAALLAKVHADCARVAPAWVAAACTAKGIAPGTPAESDEWLVGPYIVMRYARLLQRVLTDIARTGQPRLPGTLHTCADGRVTVRVFPTDAADRLLFLGFGAELWLAQGVQAVDVAARQASAYRIGARDGRVVLVLGAGNVASISPCDALDKLFVENCVVVLKTSPVLPSLTPALREGFRALIDPGYLAIVDGGVPEGSYLCRHDGIDEIHITGSAASHDAIVFGVGAEGARRKAERRPLLNKPITSELGNVSPVIVVPGPWRARDFEVQADNIAAQLVNNAGFNCNAARVVITHASWPGRERLLAALRARLAASPLRCAYYPGAETRFEAFRHAYPHASPIGTPRENELPWLLISGLDANAADELCFTTEPFCSVLSETALAAASTTEFIARAVDLANLRLAGTLNACVIVDPASRRDPQIGAAFERAIADLRYGTIGINQWPALGFALGSTTWGAFPGHDLFNVGSGIGTVHNAFMVEPVEKSVVWGPFRPWPMPPWFLSARHPERTARRLVRYEATQTLPHLLAVASAAIAGI